MANSFRTAVRGVCPGEDEKCSKNLTWHIPCSPNAGAWNVAERTVGGHPLLAIGAGRHLMILSKESFAILHTSPEMPSQVLAVAWSSVGTLNGRRMNSLPTSGSDAYGVVAAGCLTSVDLIIAEGATAGEAFPFRWVPLVTLSFGISPSTQLKMRDAWFGMHISLKGQKGLIAVGGPNGLNVWQILESSEKGAGSQATLPCWQPQAEESCNPVLHTAFSPDCRLLAWAVDGLDEVRMVTLPFPEQILLEGHAEDESEGHDPNIPDPQDQQAEKEIQAQEERLPHCMRRGWERARSGRCEGAVEDLGRREWSICVGAPCVQVAWSKASHFTAVPEIRTLIALRCDSTILVLLVCVVGSGRRNGPVVLSGMCSSLSLPHQSAPYNVWWLRESGVKRPASSAPGQTANAVSGEASPTTSVAPSRRSGHFDRRSFGSQHHDWWVGLQQSMGGVDGSVPEWLSGLALKNNQKPNSVMVQPPARADKDWIVCAGSDGKVLLYVVNFRLDADSLDPAHNHVQLLKTLQVQPSAAHSMADWHLLSYSLSQSTRRESGAFLAEGGMPLLVDLLAVAESWEGTRRSLVLVKLDLDKEVVTEQDHYVAHTETLACVAAHSTHQYVATCSVSGETLIWGCYETTTSSYSSPLVCIASLKGSFRCVAWSPALERSASLWDAGIIWAIKSDASAIEAFQVHGTQQVHRCQSLEPACSFALTMPCCDADDDEVLWVESLAKDNKRVRAHAYCHMHVVPLSWQSNAECFAPPSGPQESFKIRPPPADVHLLTACVGERMWVWKVALRADRNGLPGLVYYELVGNNELREEPLHVSSLDHFDRSWTNLPAMVVVADKQGLVVWEFADGEMRQSAHVFEFGVHHDIQVTQACLINAWELLVIGTIASNTNNDNNAESYNNDNYNHMITDNCMITDTSIAKRRTVALVLSRNGDNSWMHTETLAHDLSEHTRASSFLCGDGTALLAFTSRHSLAILSPNPWSWDELEGGHDVEGGWGVRRSGEGKDVVSVRCSKNQRYARRWTVVRTVRVSGDDDVASHDKAADQMDGVKVAAYMNKLIMHEGKHSRERVLKHALNDSMHVAWVSDGSLMACVGGRTMLLWVGIYQAPHVKSSSLSNSASAGHLRKQIARQQKPTLPALWTILDNVRGGSSVVYYHPSILRQAILCGQVDEVERRLHKLYLKLGGVSVSQQTPQQPLSSSSSLASLRASNINDNDNGYSVPPTPSEEPEETHSRASHVPSAAARLVDELGDAGLGPVKKLVGLALPDASKLVPLAKMFAANSSLVCLLDEGERVLWNADKKEFMGAPNWGTLSERIESVETERERRKKEKEEGGKDNAHADVQAASERASRTSSDGRKSDSRNMKWKSTMSKEDASTLKSLVWDAARDASKGGLTGLSLEAARHLVGIIEAMRRLKEPGIAEALDMHAVPFFLLSISMSSLPPLPSPASPAPIKPGEGGVLNDAQLEDRAGCAVPSLAVALAMHSDAQDVLVQHALPIVGDKSWIGHRAALWMSSTEALRVYAEALGRKHFQRTGDPWDAALFYVLANKTSALSALFKAKDEPKVSSFLLRDFANDEGSRIAARKNAFTLIGKHKYLGAASFFILGGAVREAVDLHVLNSKEYDIALFITRLAAPNKQQEDAAVHELIQNILLPAARETSDRGLMHACYIKMGELSAAYSALWSDATADKSLHHKRQENPTRGMGGLLSKFADDEEDGAHMQGDDKVAEKQEEDTIGAGVHPCTWWIVEQIRTRPLMLLEARTRGMPNAPSRALLLNAAQTLLCDGCAALAGQALQGLLRLDGKLGARGRALAVWACLGQLGDGIKTEAGLHASTGHHQSALTRVQQQLQNALDELGLDEREINGLLGRLCRVRSFWRLEHAVATSHFGTSAPKPEPPMSPHIFGRMSSMIDATLLTADEDNEPQNDSSLSSVATHPLTCYMADSISNLVLNLHHRTELPLPIVSRLERKGKFLQLILFSLTLDNEGDTAALAVLAASVMGVHLISLWAKRDLGAIAKLMRQDEGFADYDPAAALAWLMQACHPHDFKIGEGSRRGDVSGTASSSSLMAEPSSTNSSSSLLADSEWGTGSEQGAAGGVGVGCVLWVVLHHFCGRLHKALSAPRDSPMMMNVAHIGGASQAAMAPLVLTPMSSPLVDRSAKERERRRASLNGNSAKKVLREVSSWAARTRTFHHIQDHLKAAAGRPSSPAPSHSSSTSDLDLLVSKTPLTPSVNSFCDPLPLDHSALFLLNSNGPREGCEWQKRVPEEVGGRLLRALGGWSLKMREALQRDMLQYVIDHKVPLDVRDQKVASEFRFSQYELLGDNEPAIDIWRHYSAERYLEELLSDAVKRYEESGVGSESISLRDALSIYTMRNRKLQALGSQLVYKGTLKVRLVHARGLKLKDSMLKGAGHLFGNDAKPSTYGVLQYEGSVEHDKGDWRTQRQASIVVKKDNNPTFQHLFVFPIVAARHALTIAVMEKKSFSEDEAIGTCDMDLSQLLLGQMAEFDVPLERTGEKVGFTRLRVAFEFGLEVRGQNNAPVADRGMRKSESTSQISQLTHHHVSIPKMHATVPEFVSGIARQGKPRFVSNTSSVNEADAEIV